MSGIDYDIPLNSSTTSIIGARIYFIVNNVNSVGFDI
jgi:hypothetical protein